MCQHVNINWDNQYCEQHPEITTYVGGGPAGFKCRSGESLFEGDTNTGASAGPPAYNNAYSLQLSVAEQRTFRKPLHGFACNGASLAYSVIVRSRARFRMFIGMRLQKNTPTNTRTHDKQYSVWLKMCNTWAVMPQRCIFYRIT